MQEHEQEVVTMMSELFDEEHLREQYKRAIIREVREEAEARGRVKDKAEGFIEGLNKALMLELFDEEYLRKRYNRAILKEAYEEGRAEGIFEGLNKALDILIKTGMSEAEARKELGL